MKSINGIKYQKLNFEKFKIEFLTLVTTLRNAKDFEEVQSSINSINAKRNLWESMLSIAEINHFSDLTNPTYETALNHCENYSVDLEGLVHTYYSGIVDSAYRTQIAEVYGKQLWEIPFNKIKIFDKNLKELQVEETNLVMIEK